jgi:hypothetical protein
MSRALLLIIFALLPLLGAAQAKPQSKGLTLAQMEALYKMNQVGMLDYFSKRGWELNDVKKEIKYSRWGSFAWSHVEINHSSAHLYRLFNVFYTDNFQIKQFAYYTFSQNDYNSVKADAKSRGFKFIRTGISGDEEGIYTDYTGPNYVLRLVAGVKDPRTSSAMYTLELYSKEHYDATWHIQ